MQNAKCRIAFGGCGSETEIKIEIEMVGFCGLGGLWFGFFLA